MGMTSVSSTRAKATVEKVGELLSKYALRDVEFVLDKEGNLQAIGDEESYQERPRAVAMTDLPERWDYTADDEGEQEYWIDVNFIFQKKGGNGFIDLLRQLASCIEAPMMILAVTAEEDGACTSRAWRIEPGSHEVQELEAKDAPGNVGYDKEENERLPSYLMTQPLAGTANVSVRTAPPSVPGRMDR